MEKIICFSVIENKGEIEVRSPYHEGFVRKARQIGGSWDRKRKAVFDARDEERVRGLLFECYGARGDEDFTDLVDVRLPVDLAPGRRVKSGGGDWRLNAAPLLVRHQDGDWGGDVPVEDARQNELSLEHGWRVISSYEFGGERLWIITEGDRTSTCVLRPEEY